MRSGESTFVRLKEIGIAGHRRRRPGGARHCASRRAVVADCSRHTPLRPRRRVHAARILAPASRRRSCSPAIAPVPAATRVLRGSARIAVSPRSRVSCPSTTPPAARARPRLRPIWSACEAAPPGPIPSRPRSRRSAGRRLENPPTLQKLSRRGLRQSRRATGRSQLQRRLPPCLFPHPRRRRCLRSYRSPSGTSSTN